MFRYAIDAAGMDWIGNGDHDNGGGREYTWWLIQKLTDAYHVTRPLHADVHLRAERRLPARPPQRACSPSAASARCRAWRRATARSGDGGVHADDTKMLYRYLNELDGICASHTSATSMGTDWRDNDPEVEPIVEIYQGDRMSYEYEGAPRAGYDPKTGKEPANIAGWFPKGFVNHALRQGLQARLPGLERPLLHAHLATASSWPSGTTAQAILDAVKKRHCYGATDNIIVDVRSGDAIMGDESKTREAPELDINVLRHEHSWPRSTSCATAKSSATLKPQGRRATRAHGPTRSRSPGCTTTTSACCRPTAKSPGARRSGWMCRSDELLPLPSSTGIVW